MAENEINEYDKYKRIAVFVRPYLPLNIVNTYEKYIKNRKSQAYIYENYIKTSPCPHTSITLEDIIAVCTYIALSKENIDRAIRTYRENRRIYKRNWFSSVKDEMESPDNMKPKNPQFLRKYAQSQTFVAELDRSVKNRKTIEEIMRETYVQIENWRADTSASITDFLFLSQKPIKSLSNGFVMDVTLESLIVIKNAFGGSIEGFNMNFPTEFSEHPLFSYRTSWMNFEPELLESELTFLNKYEYEDEDVSGNITVQYKPTEDLPSIASKKSVSKVLKDYQIDLKQRALDMKDQAIMTQLFNKINGETLDSQYITVDLREFTKSVYNIKVPKHKHYEDLGNRLNKLRSYDYTLSLKNKETGEVIETSTVGLLNYLNINYQENYFLFTPSDQLKRTYVQKKYISILMDSYESIDSSQTRGIMMILQQERLTEYNRGSSEKTLTLKYFRSHMKLQKIGNAALVKELTKHLTVLMDAKVVVKNFQFVNKNSAVCITFVPLESKELYAYGYNVSNMIQTEDAIDVPFKLVDETAD